MAGQDEPDRIEIELTSHAPTQERPTSAEPLAAHEPVVEVARSKLWVAATMVGLASLLIGFVLGRAGSNDDALAGSRPADDTIVAIEEPAATTIDQTLMTIEPPTVEKNLDPPPTTADRRTTTTVTVEPESGTVGVDAALDGYDFDLVLLTSRGEVIDVDVATGGTTTRSTQRYVPLGQAGLFAGTDWLLIPDYNGGRVSTLLLDDGTVEEVETGEGWNILRQPGTDLFWRPAEANTPVGEMIEFDILNGPTGRTVEISGWPAAVDSAGGIVIQAPNGSYLVEPDGAQRLTTGALIALGDERMLTEECDETLSCGYFVIERASGDRRELEVSAIRDDRTVGMAGWFATDPVMNPQEDAVLVTVWTQFGVGRPERGVLDLETGEFAVFDTSGQGTTGAWTPDGRIVLFVTNGSLHAFDRFTVGTTALFEGAGNISAFAIRPPG